MGLHCSLCEFFINTFLAYLIALIIMFALSGNDREMYLF